MVTSKVAKGAGNLEPEGVQVLKRQDWMIGTHERGNQKKSQ
ncbi:MAG TPA: hypothetical protein VE242_14335 [Chthoniobacterales bacterium]|nr:hypothetical protein [Chthoniobacterales bacterium]